MDSRTKTEHTADWCRMPDDPFTGRFQFTMDCPACDELLAEELRQHAEARLDDDRTDA